MFVNVQSINVAISKALENLTVTTPADGVSKDFERQRAFDSLMELKELLKKVSFFNLEGYKDAEEMNAAIKREKLRKELEETDKQLKLFDKQINQLNEEEKTDVTVPTTRKKGK